MTRVISGSARGRRLAVPPGRGTRPTSDRAREGLFSTLESLLGSLAGRRVADLYAGSGAVGIEALSRGAAHCLFVEQDTAALRALRANVAAVALPGAEVVGRRVEQVVGAGLPAGIEAARRSYDVVFLDPPYGVPAAGLTRTVADLVAGGWLAPGAVVVVERATRSGPWTWPAGLRAERERRYGEATLWYGRAAQPEEAPATARSPGE